MERGFIRGYAQRGLVAACLLAGSILPASAACTSTLTLTEQTQMDFATIGPTPAGGTVTLRSSGGSLTAPQGFFQGGVPMAGAFKASAGSSAANCAVVISFTPGTLSGPGSAMTITNFTDSAGTSPTLDANGNLTFQVGADLVINPSQEGGSYSGTYAVTVIY